MTSIKTNYIQMTNNFPDPNGDLKYLIFIIMNINSEGTKIGIDKVPSLKLKTMIGDIGRNILENNSIIVANMMRELGEQEIAALLYKNIEYVRSIKNILIENNISGIDTFLEMYQELESEFTKILREAQ